MFGFTFIYHKKPTDFSINYSKKSFIGGHYKAFNHMIDKFVDDKLFYEDENHIVILDGVVLNKVQLMEQSKLNWIETIMHLFKMKNKDFPSQLKGSFAGIIFDKNKETLTVFTDHLGSKFVYYAYGSEYIIVSPYISNIYKYLQEEEIPYSLSIENAYLLLTYGFMLEDRTLSDSIKKIEPGCTLTFNGLSGEIMQLEYYRLTNTPDNSLSDDDSVELLDEQFSKAVRLQFQKDEEYHYKHFVGLSGGLDSRMTSIVAHSLGFTEQLNFTFSQSDYWDEIIAKQIAVTYHHEWIFKPLDNGLWLRDVDTINQSTGGNVLYSGSAHSHSLYKNINFDGLGLIHTGLLSGAFIGRVYASAQSASEFKLGDWAFSQKMLHRLHGVNLHDKFANQEIGNIYYRGLCGIQNGMVDSMNYSENMSPTQHVDFISHCLSVPNYQKNHLYFKWIMNKHPEAAYFGWEKIGGAKITTPHIRVRERIVPITHIPGKVVKLIEQKLGLPSTYLSKSNMNPISYYLRNNNDLKNMVKDFRLKADSISDTQLRNDVVEMLDSIKGNEVTMAMTLLSAISMYRLS